MILNGVEFFQDCQGGGSRAVFQAAGDSILPASVFLAEIFFEPGIDPVFESPAKKLRGELHPGLFHCCKQVGGHHLLVKPVEPPEDVLADTPMGYLYL